MAIQTPGASVATTLVRPVSLATLEKRIRRRLAADSLQLRKNRPGTYQFTEHGEWSVIEPRNHVLLRRRLMLEELGRELGVLAADETVTDTVDADMENRHV